MFCGRSCQTPMHILARDAHQGRWLSFSNPRRVLTARNRHDVRCVIDAVDRASRSGYWAAGLLSYEAGPAFDAAFDSVFDSATDSATDAAFETAPPGEVPLAMFGIYDAPAVLDELPWSAGESTALPPLTSTATRESFMRDVERVRSSIRKGDTYQVNLTYRLRAAFEGDVKALFQRLICAQGATYGFLLETNDLAICSASPELFFSYDRGVIRSRPMKGTLPRSNPFSDLVQSKKESAENLMILDMVRNDLARVCEIGSVIVPRLGTLEAYPTMWQLTSTAEGRTTAPLPEILDALFPPASITGAPKASTISLIKALESSHRGVYTGSLGFVAPDGRMQFNVAIRTAVVNLRRQELEFGVGGGIVWDSDPASEWEETRLKAGILGHDIPPFSLLETMRWEPDHGFFLEEAHLSRMANSALYFRYTFDVSDLRQKLDAAINDESTPLRVRVLLDESGEAKVEVFPLRMHGARPRVSLSPGSISSADPFLRHKTTHRRVYRQALADRPDVDDVILWNEKGEVTESCVANIFLEREGVLLTPPVRCGLLSGTLRASLLASGAARESVLFPEDLTSGTLKLGNSVRGLFKVDLVQTMPSGERTPGHRRQS